MRKNYQKLTAGIAFTMLATVSLSSITACKNKTNANYQPSSGVYSYNTYTAVSPSNWNELTYRDNNDRQIMSYITCGLFEYDFARNEGGYQVYHRQ